MMSPEYNVITDEWNATNSLGENSMFWTSFSARIVSLVLVRTVIVCRELISLSVVIHGPITRNVSKLLARVKNRGFCSKISSAVTSMSGTYPATTLSTSAESMFEQVRPITIPNSASAVIRSECDSGGNLIGPPQLTSSPAS